MNRLKTSLAGFLKKCGGADQQLQNRLFHLFSMAGAGCAFFAFLAAVTSGLPPLAVVSSFLCFLCMLGLAVGAFVSRNQKICGLLTCLALNMFLFPVMFFTSGGIDSGMPLYFLLGISVSATTLSGMSRNLVLVFSILEYGVCIWMGGRFPELAVKLTDRARRLDILSSFIIVAVFIGILVSAVVSEYARVYLKVSALNDRLEELSNKDELTGLYNRRYFHQIFAEKIASSAALQPAFLTLFDLDNFKKVNDGFGHETGDEVLKVFAQILRDAAGDNGIAVRYGGEEFVLLLTGIQEASAIDLSQQVCERLRSAPGLGELTGRVTVSGGMAQYQGGGMNALLRQADENMYLAKANGKDRIVYQKFD